MKTETEIKIPVPEGTLKRLRESLPETGCQLSAPRRFEENLIFDSPLQKLFENDCLLRLRTVGGKHVLTYKGKQEPDSVLKVRPEAETRIDDALETRRILEALGFTVGCRYDKHREKWTTVVMGQQLEICLDETPIGDFVEIEGDADAIRSLAKTLCLDLDKAVTRSYLELYLEAGLGQV
jgi:adenylate cyclase class 2